MTTDLFYSLANTYQIKQVVLTTNVSHGMLMERAACVSAQYAFNLVSKYKKNIYVLVLVGPGDNGNNALETAVYLARKKLLVTVATYLVKKNLSSHMCHMIQHARSAGVVFLDTKMAPNRYLTVRSWSLVVDGLFGTGLNRSIASNLRTVIMHINVMLKCYVLSLDVPSGLHANTGSIYGIAVRATHTLTFVRNKLGLYTCDGKEYSGQIVLATLGINNKNFLDYTYSYINHPKKFENVFQKRLLINTHKGTYGDVIVIGGAYGMYGASLLAARMAMHAGSGRVFLSFISTLSAPQCDYTYPELIIRSIDQIQFGTAVIVIGPGLGTSKFACNILLRVLETSNLLVLDADALNLIAMQPALQCKLQERHYNIQIITPHPLEAARLLGITVFTLQRNRPRYARFLARRFQCIVVLKGAGTLIALPNGCIIVNTTGNSALSKAGTGDILAGLCGAFLAQGLSPIISATASVWLHGKAADNLVSNHIGPIGITTTELILAIRNLLNQCWRHFMSLFYLKS